MASVSAEAHPVSASALLHRLGELHTRPHLRSSRSRRACVALILRLRHASDSPFVSLRPGQTVKVKKPRAVKTAPPPAQTAATTSPPPTATAATEPDTMTRVVLSPSPQATAVLLASLARLGAEPWTASAQLEIIFMQRAKNPQDRWSGQMSFPGGRQEKGEKDEETVVREVREEIGWDLNESSQFVRLGQLDDKPMDGLKNVKPLAVAVFGQTTVYLQVCRTSPPLVLEPTEVSSVLFVPVSYFQALRSSHDFGRIYHPLMLQILARTPSSSSGKAQVAFDLKLIGWPHKREGRLMTRAGTEQLSVDQQQALDRIDDNADHISELDEAPFLEHTLLDTLRSKVQMLAHELPLPSLMPAALSPLLARPLHLPFLPRIEQLASLRFPALSLPGVWVDSQGRGGHSTGDDIRTTELALLIKPPDTTVEKQQQQQAAQLIARATAAAPSSPAAASSSLASPSVAPPVCPPPFILWGMTLEKSCELLLFLGWPFPSDFLARGSERRRRRYAFWTGVGEARWEVERQVEGLKHRLTASSGGQDLTAASGSRANAAAAVAAAPLVVSAFAPPASAAAEHALTPSPFTTPLLIARLKRRVADAMQNPRLTRWRSRL